jgi:hypothetical protein
MEPSETGKGRPWGLTEGWAGPTFAFDVLLHESIHVAQTSIHRGRWSKGESSHNCESWIYEANRIAPLIGLNGVRAGRNRPKRVAVPGELTARGKPKTKV